MDMIRIQYLDAYDCAGKVASYIGKTTPYVVSEEEITRRRPGGAPGLRLEVSFGTAA